MVRPPGSRRRKRLPARDPLLKVRPPGSRRRKRLPARDPLLKVRPPGSRRRKRLPARDPLFFPTCAGKASAHPGRQTARSYQSETGNDASRAREDAGAPSQTPCQTLERPRPRGLWALSVSWYPTTANSRFLADFVTIATTLFECRGGADFSNQQSTISNRRRSWFRLRRVRSRGWNDRMLARA